MFIVRWLVGFIKALLGIWTKYEWSYYAIAGLDPRMAAFQRWEIVTKSEPRRAETASERLLPVNNHWVILRDKYLQRPEEELFYSTDNDKVDALVAKYKEALQTQSSGEFYHGMIRNRNLDFMHHIKFG